jgi:hypothetical protein
MVEIVKRFDVDLAKLADEVSNHLKPNWLRRNVGRFFGYLDKKGDIAIEAASTAATQKLLGGS